MVQDKGHAFYTWSLKERRIFIKTGFEPPVPVRVPLNLSVGIDDFLNHKKKSGKSRNTITSYAGHLKKSLDYFGDIAVESIDLPALQGFVSHLSQQKITRGRNIGKLLDLETQRKAIRHLRMLTSWLIANRNIKQRAEIFSAVQYGIKKDSVLNQLTEWSDFEKRLEELDRFRIDRANENAFEKTFFTKTQLTDLLRHLEELLWRSEEFKDQRLFVAICVAAYSGLRRSEITRIKRSNIQIEYGEIMILRRKGRRDAEFSRHKVHLPNHILPYVEKLLSSTDSKQQCVFVDNDSHIDGASFDEAIERRHAEALGRRLKAAAKNTKWENALTWHKFRHSLASILLSDGKTQTQVKELIGWCTDEMAQRYQHLAQTRKAEIIQSVFAGSVL